MPFRSTYPIANGTAVSVNGMTVTQYPIITADGTYPSTEGFTFQGGMGALEVFGTFGGGTATLQLRASDGSTWLPVGTNTAVTANSVVGFYAPESRMRLVVSGSVAPSLKASLRQIVER